MKKLILFSTILFFFSCDEQKINKELPTIIINPSNIVADIDFSKFVEDDIQLVALESGEGKMIGEVTNLRIIGDTIYLLDKISHSIFRYNLNGDFISKLSARGKANNEYSELSENGFYVKNLQLYIIDRFGGKLLIYDKDNNFLKSIPLMTETGELLLCDYVVESDGKFNLINKSGRTISNFHVLKIDDTGKIDSQELPIPDFKKNKSWKYGSAQDLISFSNEETYLNFYGVDTIYRLKNGLIKPIYRVDFGASKVSDEVMRGDNLFKMKGDNIIGLERLSFAGESIILHFRGKGGPYVAICNDKGEVIGICQKLIYKDSLNYVELNSPIFTDDYSVTVIKPSDGEWVESYKTKLSKYKNGNDYLDYFSSKMAEYDFDSGNPLLFIQKWK